jgi:pyruvate formate lyase activating enzyme
MGVCLLCSQSASVISAELGLCLDCIRRRWDEAREVASAAHAGIRRAWGLPATAPACGDGVRCDLCVNRCHIGEGGWGYCGLRQNVQGRLKGVSAGRGNLSWYHDPLPTNCVGDWVCPGGTGCGFPRYAYREGPEHGYKNLAVVPHACTFHCLYCQNWHFRYHTRDNGYASVEQLVKAVDEKTACICYFGGDPSPQLPFLLRASRMARQGGKGRILRICWETNGAMSKGLLREMTEISLKSGGCIKFDLKAWNDDLHLALTGVTNRQTLANFRWLAEHAASRPEPPLLIASSLMVPGYIDAREIAAIAGFIASLDPKIPYSLLGFHPDYRMGDLATTSRKHARECLQAARGAGLKRVKIGNVHLLR